VTRLLRSLVLGALAVMSGSGAFAAPQAPAPRVQPFEQAGFSQVMATAFAFMAPRTLDPIPLWQLTQWGLQGVTGLDPRFLVEVHPADSKAAGLRLLQAMPPSAPKLLLSLPAPADDDPIGWGAASGAVVRAIWDQSDPLHRAGGSFITASFFDEIFSHLDPYSRYASPAEASSDRTRRNGRATIGVTVGIRAGAFVVTDVQLGSPAALAGVKADDHILAVDQQTIQGADQQALAALLAGPEGSTVGLTLRGRDGKPRDATMERVLLPPETVTARRLGGMLIIRISSFAHNTAARFAQEIIQAVADAPPEPTTRVVQPAPPVTGIVVDLRGNRGGLLRQAVASAAMLQPEGTVAITAGRDPDAAHEFRADGRDLAPDLPVVVLVDGGTASSAEILAASLADQRRAVVVGSATLGKGLVQTVFPLPDGGDLVLTWSRVLAPRRWPLQGLGVLPQVCTSLGAETALRQLNALSQGRQPMAAALARHHAARATTPPAEVLEIRAPCPASFSSPPDVRDLDLLAARTLIDSPAAYQSALLPHAPPPSRLGAAASAGPITPAGSGNAPVAAPRLLTSPTPVSN